MHHIHAAIAADMAGVLVVMETYFRRVLESHDHEEVQTAAAEALDGMQFLAGGQPAGNPETYALKPI